MFTKQETFDRVVRHLLEQGEQAGQIDNDYGVDHVSCRYRLQKEDKVLKCAAGCLIPDEKYTEDMERKSADFGGNQDLFIELGHDVGLVRDLQIIHDKYKSFKRYIEDEMYNYAIDNGLIYNG